MFYVFARLSVNDSHPQSPKIYSTVASNVHFLHFMVTVLKMVSEKITGDDAFKCIFSVISLLLRRVKLFLITYFLMSSGDQQQYSNKITKTDFYYEEIAVNSFCRLVAFFKSMNEALDSVHKFCNVSAACIPAST